MLTAEDEARIREIAQEEIRRLITDLTRVNTYQVRVTTDENWHPWPGSTEPDTSPKEVR